jgi:hypothetical protein
LEIPNSSTTVQNFTTQGYVCGYGHASCLNISAPDVGNAYVFGGPSTPATSISVSPATVTVYVGGTTQTLTATQSPANANSGVVWSSNSANVTVSATGVITGVSAGTAKVTATAVDCGRSAECTVTVANILVTAVTLTSTATVYYGWYTTLTATVAPSNATNKALDWVSLNPSVATVNSSGVVTAVGTGSATIRATAKDGTGKYGSCTVTVNTTVPISGIAENRDHQKSAAAAVTTGTAGSKARFLAVANSQVGYRNGNKSGSNVVFPYSNADGPGWTKYTYYSTWATNENLKWCATYVSWCAEIAGVGSSIYRCRGSQEMRDKCGTYITKSNATSSNIKAGDLFYLSNDGNRTGIYHVGIVSIDYTGNGSISTVEGNTTYDYVAGYCALKSRTLSGSDIIGFSHITY